MGNQSTQTTASKDSTQESNISCDCPFVLLSERDRFFAICKKIVNVLIEKEQGSKMT